MERAVCEGAVLQGSQVDVAAAEVAVDEGEVLPRDGLKDAQGHVGGGDGQGNWRSQHQTLVLGVKLRDGN